MVIIKTSGRVLLGDMRVFVIFSNLSNINLKLFHNDGGYTGLRKNPINILER